MMVELNLFVAGLLNNPVRMENYYLIIFPANY